MLIHSGWSHVGCVEGRRKAGNAQTGGEWRRGHKAGSLDAFKMAEEPPNTVNATDQPFSNSPLRQGFSASALSAGLILGLGGCPV